MSAARFVPETWELSGDEARETLRRTGRKKLVQDAFVRFRASDGFSHARSLAFVTSLLLVQGVILLVGLAASLGDTDLSATIVRAISEAVPGPAGKALTDAVFHAYATGASGQHARPGRHRGHDAHHRHDPHGPDGTGAEPAVRHRAGPADAARSTGARSLLALTAGVLSTAAFAMFALGHGIGQGLNDDTVTQIWNVVRWPIALVLMMAAIALLFRWSPHRHQPAWSWLAFGSTVSVVLWSLATLGLGLFFQASTTFSTTYGPLAGMIAILLWSLLSSIAILFGAAIAVQLEAVRAGAAAPKDERKVELGSGQGSPALAGTA